MMDHLVINNYKGVEGLTCDISIPTEKLSELYKQKADLLERIERYEEVRVASVKLNEITPIVINFFKNHPTLHVVNFCSIRVIEPCNTQPSFLFTHNAGLDIEIKNLDKLDEEFKKLGDSFDQVFFPPRIVFSGRNSIHITMDRKPF